MTLQLVFRCIQDTGLELAKEKIKLNQIQLFRFTFVTPYNKTRHSYIYICCVCRPNGWTNLAEIVFGH